MNDTLSRCLQLALGREEDGSISNPSFLQSSPWKSEAKHKSLLKSDPCIFLVLKGLSCAGCTRFTQLQVCFLSYQKMRSDLARLQRSWWRSLLKPIGILQFNPNIHKPSSTIDSSCFRLLHINYSSNLKTPQLNRAATNNAFSSRSQHHGTRSPGVQHSYELIPGPWWTTAAL